MALYLFMIFEIVTVFMFAVFVTLVCITIITMYYQHQKQKHLLKLNKINTLTPVKPKPAPFIIEQQSVSPEKKIATKTEAVESKIEPETNPIAKTRTKRRYKKK